MQNPSVLLIQLPPWGVSTFPLGIAYIREYLHSKKVSVSVYDLNIELYNHASDTVKERWSTNEFEFWASGDVVDERIFDIDPIVDRIISVGAQIIGFSTTFASIPFCNVIVDKLRQRTPDLLLCVGGAGPSYEMHRAFYRKDLIDYFLIGEGEKLFYDLVQAVRIDEDSHIKDSCKVWKDKDDDRTECLESRGTIDLDSLPLPTYEGFDPAAYTEKDLLPILISRGCTNACHFCCDWRLKKPFRSRDPQQVIAEVEFLISKYRRRRFEFSDLLINGDLTQLDSLCDLIIQKKLSIVWGGQAAVRRDMRPKLYHKMKQAGCGSLTFGFESFSTPLLKKMNKRFSARDAAYAIKQTKKAGIRIEANLLVGFPGETEGDIDRTIKFLKKNRAYINRINSLNICSIGPGMTIWENSFGFGIRKEVIDDWYAWYTSDRLNTLAIREARHQRIKEFIDTENLGLSWENLRKEESLNKS